MQDIPHYASLAASGSAPARIRSWEDFRALPVLTREHIQTRPADFIRRSGPPHQFVRTSGSTGTPLRIGVTNAERDYLRIVKLAAWQQFGYTPASRLFLIWGHANLVGTGWRSSINHARRRIADAFLGYQRVDAYQLSRASCIAYANQLLRFRPLGLIGYAVALDQFARYTTQFRDRFRALGLRFVLATSEMLPRPDTRALLEDSFGCPLVEEYGGAEFGQVAFKVHDGPFEVYSDLNIVECEPSSDRSHIDAAVMTTLYPRYVPLIRYQTGDALRAPRRLEHGHVVEFDEVVGRVQDVVALGDGESINSRSVYHCIQPEPSVLSIQMVLQDDGIEIRLVAPTASDGDLERRLRGRLARVHPALGNARFRFVEDLQATRAGKRRWIVDDRTQPRYGFAAGANG